MKDMSYFFSGSLRAISVKRNSGCQSFEGSISQQQQRHVMVRVNVAPIRKKDNSPSIKTTGIKSVTLGPNEVPESAG